MKSKEPKRLIGSDQRVRGEDGPVWSRPLDRTDLHRGRGGPYGVCISDWRNTVNPMGGQVTDSTDCKAGQCPGGRGGGRKRRPSGNRRDRATRRGGETPPERVLTSHWSSRKRRKKGHGKRGPHGEAASGTERPWLSTHGLVPDRLDHRGMESPKPALSDLPSGLRHRRSIGLSGMRKLARAVLRGRGLATGSCYPTVAALPLPAAADARRSALQYMVSRHWASLRASAEFPTSVKEVVTLLVNSRRSISHAMRMRFIRGMY